VGRGSDERIAANASLAVLAAKQTAVAGLALDLAVAEKRPPRWRAR